MKVLACKDAVHQCHKYRSLHIPKVVFFAEFAGAETSPFPDEASKQG